MEVERLPYAHVKEGAVPEIFGLSSVDIIQTVKFECILEDSATLALGNNEE